MVLFVYYTNDNNNDKLFFQEEEALLAEMEFTGQAFEEMQEQNLRLMQQLREKDDSNLKLMSEVSTGYIVMYRVSQYRFRSLLK